MSCQYDYLLTAASNPFKLGVKTGYETPGFFSIPSNTSELSAICGTHFGLTKLHKERHVM